MRFGTVAIVGKTNVGKSTLLNRFLGQHLAIVSPLPQTTRDALLGVWHGKDARIAFVDTPGLHRPRSELGRRMNAQAIESARTADVVLFMTDTETLVATGKRRRGTETNVDLVAEEDRRLIELLPRANAAPALLVINKVDLLKDKTRLLPLLSAFQALHPFTSSIPASMFEDESIERIKLELVALLREGPPGYDSETLTDQSTRFFAREYVREQILLNTKKEVPHAVAVSIDRVEDANERCLIQATIHVEKPGQRKILVGAKGEGVRRIGIGARERLEELLGKKVRLELYVRVTPSWKDLPRELGELGYAAPVGLSGGAVEHGKDK